VLISPAFFFFFWGGGGRHFLVTSTLRKSTLEEINLKDNPAIMNLTFRLMVKLELERDDLKTVEFDYYEDLMSGVSSWRDNVRNMPIAQLCDSLTHNTILGEVRTNQLSKKEHLIMIGPTYTIPVHYFVAEATWKQAPYTL